MSGRWLKDPNAVIHYKFDWAPLENGNGDSNWLDRTSSPIESISSHTITAETGITVDSSSITDNGTTVTVTLSGGTAGSKYNVTCQVVTSTGQTDERTAIVTVLDR